MPDTFGTFPFEIFHPCHLHCHHHSLILVFLFLITIHPASYLSATMATRTFLFKQHFIIPSRCNTHRLLSTTSTFHQRLPQSSPSPPRLPKEEQEIFERLQKSPLRSTPPSVDSVQSVDDTSPTVAQGNHPSSSSSPTAIGGQRIEIASNEARQQNLKTPVTTRETELHPDARRGAPPEFEGDVNPRTGEVGGPKNEPLRWGAGGEWTYNGRATDF